MQRRRSAESVVLLSEKGKVNRRLLLVLLLWVLSLYGLNCLLFFGVIADIKKDCMHAASKHITGK